MLAPVRKAVAAAVGSLLTVLLLTEKVSFLLPPHYQAVLGVLVGILTPIATWAVPNKAV